LNFCFIGDVHSQFTRLQRAVDFALSKNLQIILLGDIFDSKIEYSDSTNVLNLVDKLVNSGHICLTSNHQDKLIRHLKGNTVLLSNGLNKTIADFERDNVDTKKVFDLLTSFPYGVILNNSHGQEFRVAHAYFSNSVNVEGKSAIYRSDLNRKFRDVFIYGKTDRDQNRLKWWETVDPDQKFVRVAGHYHVVTENQNSLVLDSGCGSSEEAPLSLYIADTGAIKEF
jgi:protein phosphatase